MVLDLIWAPSCKENLFNFNTGQINPNHFLLILGTVATICVTLLFVAVGFLICCTCWQYGDRKFDFYMSKKSDLPARVSINSLNKFISIKSYRLFSQDHHSENKRNSLPSLAPSQEDEAAIYGDLESTPASDDDQRFSTSTLRIHSPASERDDMGSCQSCDSRRTFSVYPGKARSMGTLPRTTTFTITPTAILTDTKDPKKNSSDDEDKYSSARSLIKKYNTLSTDSLYTTDSITTLKFRSLDYLPAQADRLDDNTFSVPEKSPKFGTCGSPQDESVRRQHSKSDTNFV